MSKWLITSDFNAIFIKSAKILHLAPTTQAIHVLACTECSDHTFSVLWFSINTIPILPHFLSSRMSLAVIIHVHVIASFDINNSFIFLF